MRIIRSVRRLLVALTTDQVITDEVSGSCPVEAESILKNKPLVSVSSDAREHPLLTSNRFFLPRGSNGLLECGGVEGIN